jgi:hypothetical protein
MSVELAIAQPIEELRDPVISLIGCDDVRNFLHRVQGVGDRDRKAASVE